jgi:hypothetical protein
METSVVRRRLMETMERAKRMAAERRARSDEASREYAVFLEGIAIPLFRQVSGALKASGYPYSVITPSGSVRLASDKSGDDYIELALDTSGDEPLVIGHSRRSRGRRVMESERPIGTGAVRDLTDEHVLDFLMLELEPLLDR